MAKKKFTSESIPDVFYEVLGEEWMDEDTYLIVFQEMTDADGDVYHLEVEYHKDENEIFFVRVYEYDTLSGREYVSPCFVKQIEEYILLQVGVLREGNFINNHTIEVELKLNMPKDMTVDEFNEWLNNLTVNVKSSQADKIKILKVKQK
jgi:hypothetical protein